MNRGETEALEPLVSDGFLLCCLRMREASDLSMHPRRSASWTSTCRR